MPFNRSIPPSKPRPGLSSGFGALIEAEKLMQIAFVLPGLSAHRLGRRLVDRTPAPPEMDRNRRHVLGCISGLFYVIQMAIAAEKKTSMGDQDQNGAGKGTSDPRS